MSESSDNIKALIDKQLWGSRGKVISLEREVEDEDIIYLKDLLARSPNIIQLDIEDSPYMTRTGAATVGEILRTNKSLERLSIFSCNNIKSRAAIEISAGLENNTTLTYLCLGNNEIGNKGAVAIGAMLGKNTSITYLSLQCNNIKVEGGCAIAEALKTNNTLTELSLTGNHTGDTTAVALGRALETNTTLVVLELQENHIGNEGLRALIKGLETNNRLERIEFSYNENAVIGEVEAIALIKALRVNFSIMDFEVEFGNEISTEQSGIICGLMAHNQEIHEIMSQMRKFQIEKPKSNPYEQLITILLGLSNGTCKILNRDSFNNLVNLVYVSLKCDELVATYKLSFEAKIALLSKIDELAIEQDYKQKILFILTDKNPESKETHEVKAIKESDLQRNARFHDLYRALLNKLEILAKKGCETTKIDHCRSLLTVRYEQSLTIIQDKKPSLKRSGEDLSEQPAEKKRKLDLENSNAGSAGSADGGKSEKVDPAATESSAGPAAPKAFVPSFGAGDATGSLTNRNSLSQPYKAATKTGFGL